MKQPVEEHKQFGMGTILWLLPYPKECRIFESNFFWYSDPSSHLGRKHINLHVRGGQSWGICARWWLTCLFSAGHGHSAVGAHTEPELLPQRGHGEDSSALPVWYPERVSPVALKANKGTTQRATHCWKKAEWHRRAWLCLGIVN